MLINSRRLGYQYGAVHILRTPSGRRWVGCCWVYPDVRGCAKKSGLASEALTRVQEQLEQNGQFLQIPYKNSVILVYSSFFYLEN